MRCWCHIFHGRMMWLVLVGGLHEFGDFFNGLEEFRMLRRRIVLWNWILWRSELLDCYGCNEFLMHWRHVLGCNNGFWLRGEVFHRSHWCDVLNQFGFVHLLNDFHVGWLATHNSIESIVLVGCILNDSLETENKIEYSLLIKSRIASKFIRKYIFESKHDLFSN